MLRFLRKKTPEERFWSWFTLNSRRLYRFEANQEQIFDELSEQLAKLHPSMCFEFGPEVDGRREFIVSADGHKEAFQAVQAVVRAAPSYSEWAIIPFRPPKDLSNYSKVIYGSATLSADDVWFSYEREGSLVHVDLYIRGHQPDEDGEFGCAAYLLLDLALGEYVVETRIGGIARHALPADPESLGLIPLRKIVEVVQLPIH